MAKYNLNETILQGNITRDTELKHSASGKAYCQFSIAVNEGEKVNYFEISCFDKLASSLSQYLTRGTGVIVVGKLDNNEWKDNEGNKKQKTIVIASKIILLGGGQRDGSR